MLESLIVSAFWSRWLSLCLQTWFLSWSFCSYLYASSLSWSLLWVESSIMEIMMELPLNTFTTGFKHSETQLETLQNQTTVFGVPNNSKTQRLMLTEKVTQSQILLALTKIHLEQFTSCGLSGSSTCSSCSSSFLTSLLQRSVWLTTRLRVQESNSYTKKRVR